MFRLFTSAIITYASFHRKSKEGKGISPILFLWTDAFLMMADVDGRNM
jgi:hypothetical protein